MITPIANDLKGFERQLLLEGSLIASMYSDQGDPIYGCAYYKYYCVKWHGHLYIVERTPDEIGGLVLKINKVDY